jgi:threonylcarbamoyladenosine tRNA methylthiotransferase CDKAL1
VDRLQQLTCQMGIISGEYMAGLLSAEGYTITDEKDAGDLWILNSCTVKTPSEDTFNNDIREAQSRNLPVVLSGCVPQVRHSSFEAIVLKHAWNM